MKYVILFLSAILYISSLSAQDVQEKMDLPGDNLNLYAVLKSFQESETLEGFERTLNDESGKINNLDLDGDGKIDYIQVDDSVSGNIHNIILKIDVTPTETQNVAVIVVEKEENGQVQMQLIGDEDLYGKDYIVEPDYDSKGETPNPGYTGKNISNNNQPVVTNTYYQVAAWPVIRFIFVPTYVRWRSPWHWNYYPPYWHPWRPYYWHTYYGYHYHWNYYYVSHYRRWNSYRIPGWRDSYYGGGYRARSPYVQNRYQRGDYKQTYSRPDMATQGSAMFKKDHPKAPSVNKKLPSFDKTGRPVVTKPVTKPGTRPAVTKPITTKPGTRPVVTKPGTRPVTKPGVKPGTKPAVTKPVTRPGVTKPGGTRPGTRPAVQKSSSKLPSSSTQ